MSKVQSNSILRINLSKSYFRVVILLTYLLGISLMLVRIITNSTFAELIPFWYDALVALGGIYGGGLLLLALRKSKIVISHPVDRFAFYLIAFHLLAATIGHVAMILIQNHEILNLISLEMVYLLLGGMITLTLYSFRIKGDYHKEKSTKIPSINPYKQ
ncbi:MAG: hypothetical protein ACFFFG_15955 [Candidatus Thorarchaeota archaeon]